MDFVSDSLLDGRRFRALTIVDERNRESPSIEVDSSLTGQRVVRVLVRLAATRSLTETIRMDKVQPLGKVKAKSNDPQE